MADAEKFSDEWDVVSFLASPVAPGTTRVLFCTECGALTYIQFHGNAEGLGDPVRHQQWHWDNPSRGKALWKGTGWRYAMSSARRAAGATWTSGVRG